MVWRCDDPECGCQPAPKPVYTKPTPLELVVVGSEEGQSQKLHQEGVDLDVTFLPVERMVMLREKIPGPSWPENSYKTYVQLHSENSTFVNLEGLPDNSLRLSVRVNITEKKVMPQDKWFGFWREEEPSLLYNDLVQCDWPEVTLELHLPASRIHGWKTVALVLRTFRRISRETWEWMVNLDKPPVVAGLNWIDIEAGVEESQITT